VYQVLISSTADYPVGAVCDLYPKSSPSLVQQLSTLLKLDLSQSISLQSQPDSDSFSLNTTLFSLLEDWIDIHKQPSRRGMALLLPYVSDQAQAEKISSMACNTTEGRSEFYRYVTKEKRCLSEILWDFQSIQRMEIADLVEIEGILAPRSYSIASMPGKGLIELLISIKRSTTPFGREVTGLCSQYIQRVQPGDVLRFDLRSGSLPIPPTDSHMLLVACGTGIAAFWSLLGLRISQGIGGNLLFYGCRTKECWLYEEEMRAMEGKGLLKLETVFSREKQSRRYVQHRIRDRAEMVAEALVTYDAWVYICGQARSFPSDVESAIESTLCAHFDFSPEEAAEFLKERKAAGKYHVECW
jgi:sulfite reductase alpha subunit-like flavoprotein